MHPNSSTEKHRHEPERFRYFHRWDYLWYPVGLIPTLIKKIFRPKVDDQPNHGQKTNFHIK